MTLPWEKTWLEAYSFQGSTSSRLYVISLYVSVVAMFGGVGSIVPSNYAEYVLYTGMMLFGASVRGGDTAGAGRAATRHPCTRAPSARLRNADRALAGVGVGDRLALRDPSDAQPARDGLPEHDG